MPTYAATSITGLGSVVEKALRKDIPDLEVLHQDDGLIVFKSMEQYGTLQRISYLNNLFYCFQYEPSLAKDKSVHAIVKQLTLKTSFPKLPGKTFRLMVLQGSRLVHVTREITNKLKERVAKQTGLTFSPLRADCELWVLIRNNGGVMFGYKREDMPDRSAPLHKGELRPKLAELLVMASDPQPDDVFLDPFAGYGSLPYARMQVEPYKKMVVSDNDGMLVNGLKQRFRKAQNVEIYQADARKLKFLPDESVNVIVTDPPWGIHKSELNIPVFYQEVLQELSRVLQPEGKLILLTAQPEALEVAFTKTLSLQQEEVYHTLVNGKKATVFILRKTSSARTVVSP